MRWVETTKNSSFTCDVENTAIIISAEHSGAGLHQSRERLTLCLTGENTFGDFFGAA